MSHEGQGDNMDNLANYSLPQCKLSGQGHLDAPP
jgi:hypothetical protein